MQHLPSVFTSYGNPAGYASPRDAPADTHMPHPALADASMRDRGGVADQPQGFLMQHNQGWQCGRHNLPLPNGSSEMRQGRALRRCLTDAAPSVLASLSYQISALFEHVAVHGEVPEQERGHLCAGRPLSVLAVQSGRAIPCCLGLQASW